MEAIRSKDVRWKRTVTVHLTKCMSSFIQMHSIMKVAIIEAKSTTPTTLSRFHTAQVLIARMAAIQIIVR
jgi:hypothetical protein